MVAAPIGREAMTDMLATFGKIGFEFWNTGGNCTAFGYRFEDHANEAYILITDNLDSVAPTDNTEVFVVGYYDNADLYDGEEVICNSVEEAINAVAKFAQTKLDPADYMTE